MEQGSPHELHRADGSREPSSGELARAARAGSRESFERLYDRLEGPLYRFLLLRGESLPDAEELVQDSFLRAWQNLDRYRSRWRFSTWLFTIATRLATSRRRRRRPELQAGLGGEETDPEAGPFERACQQEGRSRLWARAAQVLNTEQLQALWLRYAEDFTATDIARVLERRPGAVRVLLLRARTRLAAALRDREPPSVVPSPDEVRHDPVRSIAGGGR